MSLSASKPAGANAERARGATRWFGWPVVIPVLLGVLFALCDQATAGKGVIDLTDYEFYQRLVVSVALFVGGFAVAYRLLVSGPAMRAADRQAAERAGVTPHEGAVAALCRAHPALSFAWRPSSVVLGAVVLLLCWLIYIVCLFPGVLWYDTSWQVYEHFAGTLSDHHPFALVYLYGAFIDMGRALFDDGATGLFVLIAIQLVAAAVAFSLVCCYLRRAGVRWGVCLAILLFFGLFPYIPMTLCSVVKDTLQVVLFVYFALIFCEVVRTRGEVLTHAWVPIALILLGVAICLSKKTGVYMIAPALVAMVFLRLAHGGRALMPIIGALLLVLMLAFIPRVILPTLNVEPGGKQEMLAVPIQQVAHEYVQYAKGVDGYEDAFSDEDKQLLNDFLMIDTNDIPSEFDYTIVDPIKDGALRDESLIPDFLRLWARLGAQHPLGHLEAWLGMEAGWASYEPAITVKVASGTVANADFVSQYVTWPSSNVRNDFVTSLYNFVGTIPVINIAYNQAIWATVLPFFALFAIAKSRGAGRWGRLRMLVMASPWLMTMVTLFICPVSTGVEVARYILPMVCIAPLMLGLLVVDARTALVARVLGDEDDDASPADAAVASTAAAVEKASGAAAGAAGDAAATPARTAAQAPADARAAVAGTQAHATNVRPRVAPRSWDDVKTTTPGDQQ